MTTKEARTIITLLESGMVYIHPDVRHQWGLEYHVPDVLMWNKGMGRGRSEKIMSTDEITLFLMQYHFGQIRRHMKNAG
ncbi:MAG: hypothetical protein ACK4NC_03685 [Candidatus Gracilibacteria bacterium]